MSVALPVMPVAVPGSVPLPTNEMKEQVATASLKYMERLRRLTEEHKNSPEVAFHSEWMKVVEYAQSAAQESYMINVANSDSVVGEQMARFKQAQGELGVSPALAPVAVPVGYGAPPWESGPQPAASAPVAVPVGYGAPPWESGPQPAASPPLVSGPQPTVYAAPSPMELPERERESVSGELSRAQVSQYCAALRQSSFDIDEFFKSYDTDGSGTLSFGEFAAYQIWPLFTMLKHTAYALAMELPVINRKEQAKKRLKIASDMHQYNVDDLKKQAEQQRTTLHEQAQTLTQEFESKVVNGESVEYMPSPASIELQQQAYQKSLDSQLEQGLKIIEEQKLTVEKETSHTLAAVERAQSFLTPELVSEVNETFSKYTNFLKKSIGDRKSLSLVSESGGYFEHAFASMGGYFLTKEMEEREVSFALAAIAAQTTYMSVLLGTNSTVDPGVAETCKKWMVTELEGFAINDTNNNGSLDMAELESAMSKLQCPAGQPGLPTFTMHLPTNYGALAEHFIKTFDISADGVISKAEWLVARAATQTIPMLNAFYIQGSLPSQALPMPGPWDASPYGPTGSYAPAYTSYAPSYPAGPYNTPVPNKIAKRRKSCFSNMCLGFGVATAGLGIAGVCLSGRAAWRGLLAGSTCAIHGVYVGLLTLTVPASICYVATPLSLFYGVAGSICYAATPLFVLHGVAGLGALWQDGLRRPKEPCDWGLSLLSTSLRRLEVCLVGGGIALFLGMAVLMSKKPKPPVGKRRAYKVRRGFF